MAPDKDKLQKIRKATRPEFESVSSARGRRPAGQRKLPERQLSGWNDSQLAAASIGDDTLRQADGSPPRLDRAG